ncbi:MAG: DNA mismatch repair protein MutL, partial [Alphaproteobacteria bacterium CG_4_10_14_0_8_um_filter_53_9]
MVAFMPIRTLPENLANQIAAGEVVERPASVIKELVENSLDAGATNIRVEVEDGGSGKILVQDNGSGIPKEELVLALSRHATSKVASTEDLFNIHTFGFRGEALPSIASVSRLTLTSRAAGSDEAWQITPEGELRPASLPNGTKIEVEDLFYATPARRKFQKSERSERMAIEDLILKLALSNPHVSFTLVQEGKQALSFPPVQTGFWGDAEARIKYLAGDDVASHGLRVEAEREGTKLTALITPAQRHIGQPRNQFLFINGRPIKDRSLAAAVKNAYGDALPPGRHPSWVMMLEVPSDEVDVNVHPAKSEVRLKNQQGVFGLIYAAIRHTLTGTAYGGREGGPGEGAHTTATDTYAAINPHTFALLALQGQNTGQMAQDTRYKIQDTHLPSAAYPPLTPGSPAS